MKLNRNSRTGDIPATIPLFPLTGALLLPRRPIQLTVFEPRYLEMLDDALGGERLVGMIQPTSDEAATEPHRNCSARLRWPNRSICGDRRRPLFPDADGRRALPLIARGAERAPLPDRMADYSPFAEDFLEGAGEAAVDRDELIAALKRFAEVNEIKVVWSDIRKASNEALVNGLSMMSPYGPKEKQALLEATDLRSRAEMLVAISKMDLARGQDAATDIFD